MAASSRCHVIELRLFGGLDLRRSDGRELDSILTQPKRVALLAFLATATPYRLHRRDTLLGLFWPELDRNTRAPRCARRSTVCDRASARTCSPAEAMRKSASP